MDCSDPFRYLSISRKIPISVEITRKPGNFPVIGNTATPRSMKQKVVLQKRKIQALMNERYSNRKHISRLKKQVTSLKTIVSELRKTRALADSGLECLEAIADTDISQFLKRFIQNQKN